jgi:hypothetical protein
MAAPPKGVIADELLVLDTAVTSECFRDSTDSSVIEGGVENMADEKTDKTTGSKNDSLITKWVNIFRLAKK